MTDKFFGKTLAAHKVDAIPGMLEFDIPVHGDNRGWFKEKFPKRKKCCHLDFQSLSLQKENCKTMYPSHAKMFSVACMQNHGISTSL